MKPRLKKTTLFIASLAMCQFIGLVGSVFTVSNISSWYSSLNKPAFNPPNWVFAPVWILLYALMGISFYLVIIKQKKIFSPAVCLFLLQLTVNLLWSIVFFSMKQITLSLVVIAILWGLIFSLIQSFRKISKTASNLLIPYLVWVTFASILNLSIWLLN